MFRRESQFPPSESRKITSSTCISPPAARRGRLSTSCFGGSTTRTRVTTKDPRSGDGIAKTLSSTRYILRSYVSHLEIALLRTAPIIRISYFAIFPKPSRLRFLLPHLRCSLVPFPNGFYGYPYHATSLPKTTAFTYVTGVSKRALAPGLKETSPHDGVFRPYQVRTRNSANTRAAHLHASYVAFFSRRSASSAIPLQRPNRLNKANRLASFRSVEL